MRTAMWNVESGMWNEGVFAKRKQIIDGQNCNYKSTAETAINKWVSLITSKSVIARKNEVLTKQSRKLTEMA